MKIFYKLTVITMFLGVAMLATGCATNNKMISDSHNPGMTKIVYSVDINASKTKSWAVLAEFDNLDWTDTVTDAHYLNEKRSSVGTARHCDLNDDGYIVERITAWDEGNGFTYAIDDASGPIVPGSYVIWNVTGDENRSKVTFEIHYELKYGLIGDMMNAAFAKDKFSMQIAGFIDELKAHVEDQAMSM